MINKYITFALVTILAIAMTSCGNKENKSLNEEEQYHINYSEKSNKPSKGKTVLVIASSPHKGGNTELMADEFIKGAKEVGANVEKIVLADKKIDFFTEQDENFNSDSIRKASQRDDVDEIAQKIIKSDVIVLAGPVYFMNIEGKLKTFFDRTFYCYRDMKDKEFFYITACADPKESTADRAIEGFRGFVMCLPNPTERGMIKAIGMGRHGGVKKTQYMQQAYKLGKNV